MKKILIATLMLVLVLSLAACGGNSGSSSTPPANNTPSTTAPADNTPSAPSEEPAKTDEPAAAEWPANDYTALIPKPEAGTFTSTTIEEHNDSAMMYMTWTTDEMMAYVEQAKAAGWDGYSSEHGEGSDYRYTANKGEDMNLSITIKADGILVTNLK